jgi:hypothetical protein
LHHRLQGFRLLIENLAHVLVGEQDPLEGIRVDLVELPAELAESDRQ